LRGEDLPVANLRCGFGSLFSCVLVCVPQLGVKTGFAHSSCFAAVALLEVMTTGWTIEINAAHRVGIWVGSRFRPALNALLTDDSVTPDAESGHLPAHQAG
jgi:hypothetical protein